MKIGRCRVGKPDLRTVGTARIWRPGGTGGSQIYEAGRSPKTAVFRVLRGFRTCKAGEKGSGAYDFAPGMRARMRSAMESAASGLAMSRLA
jgi:hypothetical protein